MDHCIGHSTLAGDCIFCWKARAEKAEAHVQVIVEAKNREVQEMLDGVNAQLQRAEKAEAQVFAMTEERNALPLQAERRLYLKCCEERTTAWARDATMREALRTVAIFLDGYPEELHTKTHDEVLAIVRAAMKGG